MRARRQPCSRTVVGFALALVVGALFVVTDGSTSGREQATQVASTTSQLVHVQPATAPPEVRVVRGQRHVRRAVALSGCLAGALAIAAIARRRRGERTSTPHARLERARTPRAPPHLRVS
jgi:hypothetical protein